MLEGVWQGRGYFTCSQIFIYKYSRVTKIFRHYAVNAHDKVIPIYLECLLMVSFKGDSRYSGYP